MACKSFKKGSIFAFFRCNLIIFMGLEGKGGRGWGCERRNSQYWGIFAVRLVFMADFLYEYCARLREILCNDLAGTCGGANRGCTPGGSWSPTLPANDAGRVGHPVAGARKACAHLRPSPGCREAVQTGLLIASCFYEALARGSRRFGAAFASPFTGTPSFCTITGFGHPTQIVAALK